MRANQNNIKTGQKIVEKESRKKRAKKKKIGIIFLKYSTLFIFGFLKRHNSRTRDSRNVEWDCTK